MRLAFALAVLVIACGQPAPDLSDGSSDGSIDGADVVAPDGASGRCSIASPFGAPEIVVNAPSAWPSLSADGLRLYYTPQSADIVVIERATLDGKFGTPKVALAGAIGAQGHAVVSPDETRAYVMSGATAPTFFYRMYERSGSTGGFSGPTPVQMDVGEMRIGPDGNAYGYVLDTGTLVHLGVATTTDGKTFSSPVLLPGLKTTVSDSNPVLSADLLTIYFASSRPGGKGQGDIWVSTRPSSSNDWAAPMTVPEASSTTYEAPGALSADGCELFFTRNAQIQVVRRGT